MSRGLVRPDTSINGLGATVVVQTRLFVSLQGEKQKQASKGETHKRCHFRQCQKAFVGETGSLQIHLKSFAPSVLACLRKFVRDNFSLVEFTGDL